MNTTKTAIIDIGSNTIRLVLYTYDAQKGLKEEENVKTVARLSSHLQSDGTISEEGIEILRRTLRAFREMLYDFGVSEIRATATAAIRQAKNGNDIVELMEKETGIPIEILSEEEEAYFGFLAVAHTVSTQSAVTIDIGGGSTEITYYKNKKLQKTHSFPFGAVSLKQKFVKGDRMTENERMAIGEFAKSQFSNLKWLHQLKLPVIGIGGSARNIAQIDQQRKNYPISGVHQYEMSNIDLDEISEFMVNKTPEELKQVNGLSSDRADIIAPVLEVFRALMTTVESKQFQFSKYGLREGIIINKILQCNPDAFDKYEVLEYCLKILGTAYGREEHETIHYIHLVKEMYNQCCEIGVFEYDEAELKMLMHASKVFYIGEFIEKFSASQHTFYLLSNRSIEGLQHRNRIKLALLASYKNREVFKRYVEPFINWFTKEELKKIRELGVLLKFTYSLNVSKRNVIKKISIHKVEKIFKVVMFSEGNAMAEIYQANRQKKHLERLLKCEVVLEFIEKDGIEDER